MRNPSKNGRPPSGTCWTTLSKMGDLPEKWENSPSEGRPPPPVNRHTPVKILPSRYLVCGQLKICGLVLLCLENINAHPVYLIM